MDAAPCATEWRSELKEGDDVNFFSVEFHTSVVEGKGY